MNLFDESATKREEFTTTCSRYNSFTKRKSLSNENHSSEESCSDEETSPEFEARFHSNLLQARARRNAIDFSPMDITKHESLEDEEIGNNQPDESFITSPSSSEEELDFFKPTGTEECVQHDELRENFNNNSSCASSYEMPVQSCRRTSSCMDVPELDENAENLLHNVDTASITIGTGNKNPSTGTSSSSDKLSSDKEVEEFSNSDSISYLSEEKSTGSTAQQSLLESDTVSNDFSDSCFAKSFHNLCNFLYISDESKPTFPVSLTHPNAPSLGQPITAKTLISLLECGFVYMHGGADLSNAPIICFPHYPDLRTISDEDFQNVILYLTSIASSPAADVGFVLVLDRRRDKWASLRAILNRLAACFPASLKMVLVLRPAGFFQGTISDLGFRFHRDEFSMKITMLSTLDELYTYIHPDQLAQEYGGSYDYDHKTWMRNRVLLEDFSLHAVEIGFSLDSYALQLAQTELPNDVGAAQALIKTQQESTRTYKDKLNALLDAATSLKETILVPISGSLLPNSQSSLEIRTLDNMLSLVGDTETVFEKFWMKHREKLQQCLQLRQFEQNYRDARFRLTVFEQWFDHQKGNVGSSVSVLHTLLNEAEQHRESFVKCQAECSQLASEGRSLIETHYAVDCIAPKCDELLETASGLSRSFEKRIQFLTCVHRRLKEIENLNNWCNSAMSLLAGQPMEKSPTIEGAKETLAEMERFFDGEGQVISSDPTLPALESCVQAANKRLGKVLQLYEECRESLKKSISKCSDRPVQLVEPSKADISDNLNNVSTNFKSRRTKPRVKLELEKYQSLIFKKLFQIDLQPQHSSKSSHVTSTTANDQSDAAVKMQHALKELLTTERTYVEVLKSIVEGYGEAIDDESLSNLVPEKLRGKRTVLLGNMDDIYRFHSKVFLADLEECMNEPQLIGRCFVRRKSEFNIYAKYCQNSLKSEQLRLAIGEKHAFFLECQKRLGHRLALSAYLLKPVQRITKYQLLLQQISKYEKNHTKELEDAIQAMLDVLKWVNDSMHQTAIVGYQGDFDDLGQLCLQGPLQIEHKKSKGKNLSRPRFNKTWQRHVFLYEKEMLLCKLQNSDAASSDNSAAGGMQHTMPLSSGGAKGHHYLYKTSLKMNGAGVTENPKGDSCKFEIWYQAREEVYAFHASTAQLKHTWLKEIKSVLSSQPKVEMMPPERPITADVSKSAKAKRSQSLNRGKRPTSAQSERQRIKSESKKNSSLSRSASMGKGRDKHLKRVNAVESDNKVKVGSADNLIQNGELEPPVFSANIKSASLSHLADADQSCSSDVDEGFDSATVLTSDSSASGCRFVVTKDRCDVIDEEVELRVGDVVQVLEAGKEGWVKVRIEHSGSVGWAPTNHIRSVSDASSYDSVSSFTSS